jgi:hypothetical protein
MSESLELDPNMDVEIETPHGSKDERDALKDELDGPELDEMTDEQLRDSIEDINEDLVDYLKIKSKSEDKEEASRAKLQLKIYDDMMELFEDIKPLIEAEKFEKAEKKTIDFLDDVEKKLKKSDIADDRIKDAIQQTQDLINLYGEMVDVTKDRPTLKMTLLSEGIDLIPFVGGAKIATEGLVGRNLAGEKYGLMKRVFKMGEGTFWVLVDTAGLVLGAFTAGGGELLVEGAAIAAKGAKGTKALAKVGKTAKGFSKSSRVLRAVKGTGKGARALESVARFAVKHPSLVTSADNIIRAGKVAGEAAKVRTNYGVTKAALKAPVNWTKRKLVLRRFRQEREEFVAALGKNLDSGTA